MDESVQLPGEVMHVLGHAAQLRVIVFRDQSDTQWTHRARWANRCTADTTAAGRSSCK